MQVCGSLRLLLPSVSGGASAWDDLLVQVVNWSHSRKHPFSAALYGILAAQRKVRITRRELPFTWELLWAWKLQLPSACRIPLPRPILEALVATAMGMAAATIGKESLLWFQLGVCLWLGFEALLRPMELLSLVKADIVISWEVGNTLEVWLVLRICEPKNRRSFARTQFVLVEDPWLVRWVAWLISDLQASDFLFSASAARALSMLRALLALLGLQALKFTLGSLRPGGATEFFRVSGGNVPALQFRGRWASTGSLTHYLQLATAALMEARIPDDKRKGIAEAVNTFNTLKIPPADALRVRNAFPVAYAVFYNRASSWLYFDRESGEDPFVTSKHKTPAVPECGFLIEKVPALQKIPLNASL